MFRTEDGRNFKNFFVNANERLFIKLGRLRKENFLTKLNQQAAREIENGSSLYGIQRDDLKIFINDREAKTYGSQGQQRTAVLSLKMAQMEHINETRGEYPVLLLDDIMSELDISRRQFLTEKIRGKQVIITCTDAEDETPLGTEFFRVEAGRIIKDKKL